MKQLFLPLLACLMFVSSFAQNEADKWVITPVKGLKKGMGRLSLNYPAGVGWNVDIYNNHNKFIINRNPKTFKQKQYELAAGIYNFRLSSVLVENVPIEEGKETRLKAGILDIPVAGDWELRSESKEEFLTSGNTQQKIALPAGKYQLKEGKDFRLVEIIDEFEFAFDEDYFTIDAERYTMVPVPVSEDTAMQSKGRLALKFPPGTEDAFLPIPLILSISQPEETSFQGLRCGNTIIHCPPSYPLYEGNYIVSFSDGNTNSSSHNLVIPNVSIRKGYETRIKVGYLVHGSNGIYQIYDETKQKLYMVHNSQGLAGYPLPIGNYWVKLMFVGGEYRIQMKDGKATVISPMDSAIIPKSKWIVTSLLSSDKKLPNNLGRLNTFFPDANNIGVSVRVPNPSMNTGYSGVGLTHLDSYDLLPGNYRVFLNAIPIDVPIQAGRETRIRFGYLKISVGGGEAWKLYNVKNVVNYMTSVGPRKIALPIGYYKLIVAAHSYLIKINEGEEVKFQAN